MSSCNNPKAALSYADAIRACVSSTPSPKTGKQQSGGKSNQNQSAGSPKLSVPTSTEKAQQSSGTADINKTTAKKEEESIKQIDIEPAPKVKPWSAVAKNSWAKKAAKSTKVAQDNQTGPILKSQTATGPVKNEVQSTKVSGITKPAPWSKPWVRVATTTSSEKDELSYEAVKMDKLTFMSKQREISPKATPTEKELSEAMQTSNSTSTSKSWAAVAKTKPMKMLSYAHATVRKAEEERVTLATPTSQESSKTVLKPVSQAATQSTSHRLSQSISQPVSYASKAASHLISQAVPLSALQPPLQLGVSDQDDIIWRTKKADLNSPWKITWTSTPQQPSSTMAISSNTMVDPTLHQDNDLPPLFAQQIKRAHAQSLKLLTNPVEEMARPASPALSDPGTAIAPDELYTHGTTTLVNSPTAASPVVISPALHTLVTCTPVPGSPVSSHRVPTQVIATRVYPHAAPPPPAWNARPREMFAPRSEAPAYAGGIRSDEPNSTSNDWHRREDWQKRTVKNWTGRDNAGDRWTPRAQARAYLPSRENFGDSYGKIDDDDTAATAAARVALPINSESLIVLGPQNPVTSFIKTLRGDERMQEKTARAVAAFDDKEKKLDLWHFPLHYDLIIKCQRSRWFVHRDIVLRDCQFFAACLPPPHIHGVRTWVMGGQQALVVGYVLQHLYGVGYRHQVIDADGPLAGTAILNGTIQFLAGAELGCVGLMANALHHLEQAVVAVGQILPSESRVSDSFWDPVLLAILMVYEDGFRQRHPPSVLAPLRLRMAQLANVSLLWLVQARPFRESGAWRAVLPQLAADAIFFASSGALEIQTGPPATSI